MDSLKRPETVISLVNTAALLGASIYFYRKINNLELELNKHSEHLTTTVRKVREMTVYKKHITGLVEAIKSLNNALGNSHRDVETLKELVKYQSGQIVELQTALLKLDTTENKSDIKLKENPYLRNLVPVYAGNNTNVRNNNRHLQQPQQPQYLPPTQNFPAQGIHQPLIPQTLQAQQGYNQPLQAQQGYNQPLQAPQGYNQPLQAQTIPQQGQAYNQQGYNQPTQNQYSQQGYSQGYQQPYQSQSGRGNELLNFMNEPAGQFYNNQNSQNNFSDEGNTDDDDAAIEAVRRARQQNSDDLPFF